jgi:hypothetical protein
MPTLTEMQRSIGELVFMKGFGNAPEDFPQKLFFALIELGEAGNTWKKGMRLVGPETEKPFKTVEELRAGIAEEIIDAIFYELDAMRVYVPEQNPDEVFLKKLTKNMGREHRYGEDPSSVKHTLG